MKNSFKSFKLFLLIISLLGLASCGQIGNNTDLALAGCDSWNQSIEESAKSSSFINPKVAARNEATATPLEVETTYALRLLLVGQNPELKLPFNKVHTAKFGQPAEANQSAGFFSFTPTEDGTYVAFAHAKSWMDVRTAVDDKLATVPASGNVVCKAGKPDSYGKHVTYELKGGEAYILGIYRSNDNIVNFAIKEK